MRSRFVLYTVLYGAITGGIVASASAIVIQNNSWTNTPGGKWEDGTKWSLGVPPALGQATIFVTNVVSKTVTIDATTSGGFPTNMTINNLVIGAPAGSVNTLSLLNAGTNTPLHVLNSNILSNGGVLTISNSAFQVDGLSTGINHIDGSASVLGGGRMVATNTFIGSLPGANGTLTLAAGGTVNCFELIIAGAVGATGTVWMTGGELITTNNGISIGGAGIAGLIVSNGTLLASGVALPDGESARGTLIVAGGNTIMDDIFMTGADSATGTVLITGGQLTVTDSINIGEPFGSAQMTISNGTFSAEFLFLGVGANSSPGILNIAGGTNVITGELQIGSDAGTTGVVWMTGGQLIATNADIYLSELGVGRLILSNGTLLASTVTMGDGPGAQGDLIVAGGIATVGDLFMSGSANATGTVLVSGGQLMVTDPMVVGESFGSAQITVSNGTFSADSILLGVFNGVDGPGTLTVAGGTSLITSNLTLGNLTCSATGVVTLDGGSLYVTNAAGNATLEIESGTLSISGGLLRADRIVITNACAHFVRTGGTVIYGTAVLNPADDSDGDGFTNQQELNAGTDPLNPSSFPGPVTSWTDGTGKWEVSTNWSSGLPSSSLHAVFVTNAATKTVTINSATPLVNMTISNLTVSGSPGTVNTLQITNVGLATPFTVLNSFTNSSGGNVVVTNSLLRVQGVSGGTFVNNGTFTILGGGVLSNGVALDVGSSANTTGSVWMTGSSAQLVVTNGDSIIGDFGVGRITVSNGTWLASSFALVGFHSGSQGTLLLAGGTNILAGELDVGVAAGATGTVWMTGGSLNVGGEGLGVADSGIGQMTVSNGTCQTVEMQVGISSGSDGTLTIAGGAILDVTGNLVAGSSSHSTGVVWLTAGQVITTNATAYAGNFGVGQLIVSNGTWQAHFVEVGSGAGSHGTLTFAGGTISLADLEVGTSVGATGAVWMTGGQLIMTNADAFIGDAGVGQVTVSNGTWLGRSVTLGDNSGSSGTLTLAGGTSTFSDILSISESNAVWVTGGQLNTTNQDTIVGEQGAGQMTVSNGTWQGSDVIVASGASSQGTLTIAGGASSLGLVSIGNLSGATGTVWMTGGQLLATNLPVFVGDAGIGRMTVSNGTMRAVEMRMGDTSGSQGTLSVAGGTSSVYSDMIIGVSDCSATGIVTVVGGSLFVTNATHDAVFEVRSGTLTIGGGLLKADRIVITNACAHFVRSGGTLQYTSSVLNPNDDTDGDGFTNQQEINAGTDPLDPGSFPSPVTSWTDGAGKWEVSTNWSAGVPSISFQGVFVTNASSKTVTIDATTTGSFPGTMTISNLTVSSPAAGATNTLALVSAGLAVPLHVVNTFTILDRGALTITNSAMFVEGAGAAGLAIENGNISLIDGSLVSTSSPTAGNLILGNDFGHGQMTVAGGSLSVGLCILGKFSGSQGTLTISGGTNIIGNLAVGNNAADTTGTVWMTGGFLTANFGTSIGIGGGGVGKMVVSNGSVQAFSVLMRGPSSTLTMAGGVFDTSSSFQIGSDLNSTSSVWITGGQLSVTNGTTSVAVSGAGQMTVSNGTYLARDVSIASGFGNGTLTIVSGTTVLSSNLSVAGAVGRTGTVWITGGKLVTTNASTSIGVQGFGRFTVSNGTWLAKDVFLGSEIFGQGTLTIVGGTNSNWSSLTLGAADCTATGVVAVTGGSLFVTNAAGNATLEVQSGTLSISGGLLKVDRIVITNACAHFTRTGGTLIYGSAVLNPADDTDGDGFSNQEELNAGSDPLDPNSVPSGQLSVTPATLNFGTIATGITAQASFIVSNSAVGLLSGSATVTGGPFAILSGSPFSVTANGSTNVVVQFAPVSTGAFTNKVVFNAGAGGTSSNTVTGTGALLPVANFTAAPTNGVAPLLVSFTDASSGTITNRLWSFGDSGTSTLASPSHTYSNAGVYSVSLTVFGPVGSSATNRLNLITVTNVVPVAGFSASPTNGAAPLSVSFSDTSTGTITNRFWTFGDGATSSASLVMHTYSTAGVYSVSLMVFGPGGSDTLNQPGLITVTNAPPTAGFTANPTNGVAPLLVNFTDGSTGTITNRLWDFGDGGSSTTTSPSHTYTNAGNYSVTLTVFGPTGTDALTQPELIVVTSGPTNADLEVIKLGSPNPVFVASNLTYTITVTNHGPATATSITLTDALPTSVTFSSASDECTNTGGIVVCDLGSLDAGEATNVTLVVVPTVAGKLTNTASVAATETDPVPANNTVTNTVTVTVPPLGTNDLAVVKLKAPKKIALSATTTNKVGKFSVTIQNRGPLTETIPDLAALSNLVTVSVQSLGTNCPSFSATLVPPKASFPINIAPNKKLTLIFTAIFNCANDPLASSKTISHSDYRTTAIVDLGALGEVDTATSNDLCPRPPSGSDPGCGNKDPVTKQLGADVLTDVVVK